MDFDLDRIINGKRDTSAGYHFLVGRGWRLLGEPNSLHSPLAYAAFEFRCSIERSVFELFVLVRKNTLSAGDMKATERFSSLRTALLQAEGGKRLLQRKLEFNRIYAQATGLPKQYWPSVPDIGILEKYWSKLSEYCHRQLQPKATWDSMGGKWISEGYALLNDVEKYLWEITVTHQIGWFQVDTLPPEMLTTRRDFVNGKIDSAALVTRVQLMEPVIRQRARRKFGPR
jgi:hypothetical protein